MSRRLLLLPLLLLFCAPQRPEPQSGPSCRDGEKNGDEIDVDCGGSCGPCGNGKTCTSSETCASGLCEDGSCQRQADCVAEDDDGFCERTGRTCGSATGLDDCGDPRTAECGECPREVICTGAPSSGVPAGLRFKELSTAQRTTICDFDACLWGGYGSGVSCEDGFDASGPSTLEGCLEGMADCGELTVAEFESCRSKIMEDPCDMFSVVFSAPECAAMRQHCL